VRWRNGSAVSTTDFDSIYLLKFEASVRLCAPWYQKALTLYPATNCAGATDISGVSGRWQLSR